MGQRRRASAGPGAEQRGRWSSGSDAGELEGKTDPTGRARVSATQEAEARGRAGALNGPGEKAGPRLGLRERRKEKGRAEIAGLKTLKPNARQHGCTTTKHFR